MFSWGYFVWDCFVCFFGTILSGSVLSGNILLYGTALYGSVLSGTVLSALQVDQFSTFTFHEKGNIGEHGGHCEKYFILSFLSLFTEEL